ncbi:MAG: alpha/beta hydrolase [Proteobacteria bacterium]|nr:alpha/beta hydrolase [Pseudomonadota bacterium]
MRACLTIVLPMLLLTACCVAVTSAAPPTTARAVSPLIIGQAFTLDSKVLGERRRINVFLPDAYTTRTDLRLPVLYMPDGGIGEDFLHVAGLLQVLIGNGSMRPFLLVGIENTQRRRDLTPPTHSPTDRAIAPVVGQAAAFRSFLATELIPEINVRYRTTGERAIVGESLAGLFVLDTLQEDPELFDTYMAFDPSLWWDDASMAKSSCTWLQRHPDLRQSLYIASSSEPSLQPSIQQMTASLSACAPPGLHWAYQPMPGESHGTIYHPAALLAFRKLLAPPPTPP